MSYKYLFYLALITLIILSFGCEKQEVNAALDHDEQSTAIHEEHDGHDNEGELESEVHSENETQGHEGHGHESEPKAKTEIELSPEAIKMAEITIAQAKLGAISASLELSGEVGFNEDRLVHITPRYAGIAKEVRSRIGDFVNEGATVAIIESNESMTHYSLKAPISGRIIDKHIAVGEHVSEEESVYLLADLSKVWVNLAIYQKDAPRIKAGQKVTITAIGSNLSTNGTIDYVTPVINAQTRKITARVVLANGNGQWRPGTFVNAQVEIGKGNEGIVIERNAVQTLDGKQIVFIQHEPNTFVPIEVAVGESDSHSVQILEGLVEGTEYVNQGAFELKAKIVTSTLGGHAGHGH